MDQKLEKTINEVDSAAAAFRSIQWPLVDANTNIDSLIYELSEITGIVNGCQYPVQEAGSNARSTGWYVGQELWGGVHSDDWHAAADLAESLDDRLGQIGEQTWAAHQAIAQLDDESFGWRESALREVARINTSAPVDSLTAALRNLSFLNY